MTWTRALLEFVTFCSSLSQRRRQIGLCMKQNLTKIIFWHFQMPHLNPMFRWLCCKATVSSPLKWTMTMAMTMTMTKTIFSGKRFWILFIVGKKSFFIIQQGMFVYMWSLIFLLPMLNNPSSLPCTTDTNTYMYTTTSTLEHRGGTKCGGERVLTFDPNWIFDRGKEEHY